MLEISSLILPAALIFIGFFLVILISAALFFLFILMAMRAAILHTFAKKPKENLILSSIYPAMNTDPLTAIEIAQRAETGKPYHKFASAAMRLSRFDELLFNPAQLDRLPVSDEAEVSTEVTIGKKAKKPLTISKPIIIGGMGFGVGLSLKARIALAKASRISGIALAAGDHGFLEEERMEAEHYIASYTRGEWTHDIERLKKADMIEIVIGQGANPSVPWTAKTDLFKNRALDAFDAWDKDKIGIASRLTSLKKKEELGELVSELKNATGGVPIGIKMAATNSLERDMEIAVESGVDAIILDSAQGGSGSAPQITIDSFGLPLIFAIPRASRHLIELGARRSVTLIVAGGIRTSSDILKALALGADCVYMCTAILIALVHTQVIKAWPGSAPFSLLEYGNENFRKLDVEEGVRSLSNFIEATNLEITAAVKALGKTSIHDVGTEDLIALNKEISDITGAPLCYKV